MFFKKRSNYRKSYSRRWLKKKGFPRAVKTIIKGNLEHKYTGNALTLGPTLITLNLAAGATNITNINGTGLIQHYAAVGQGVDRGNRIGNKIKMLSSMMKFQVWFTGAFAGAGVNSTAGCGYIHRCIALKGNVGDNMLLARNNIGGWMWNGGGLIPGALQSFSDIKPLFDVNAANFYVDKTWRFTGPVAFDTLGMGEGYQMLQEGHNGPKTIISKITKQDLRYDLAIDTYPNNHGVWYLIVNDTYMQMNIQYSNYLSFTDA